MIKENFQLNVRLVHTFFSFLEQSINESILFKFTAIVLDYWLSFKYKSGVIRKHMLNSYLAI